MRTIESWIRFHNSECFAVRGVVILIVVRFDIAIVILKLSFKGKIHDILLFKPDLTSIFCKASPILCLILLFVSSFDIYF